jgi:hypothetical protein
MPQSPSSALKPGLINVIRISLGPPSLSSPGPPSSAMIARRLAQPAERAKLFR